MDYRVILYHKQATSARTRFLRFGHDSVCAPHPVSMPAQLLDGDDQSRVDMHPAGMLREMEKRIGFERGCLKAEGEFRTVVETPRNNIRIFLARIDTIDPPFAVAEQADSRFIDLTQARDLPTVELQLLRQAYELIMGG